MRDFHGIIFAYKAAPELGELSRLRTSASLPFCGRYRLVDFALSSMTNAGIRDVGLIVQRDYQSLLDHVGSGKSWDMSLKKGGLRMLPPFGLPEYHKGNYAGTMEALNSVYIYIRDIPQKYVVLMLGNVCANVDLNAAMEQHLESGAEITALCASENYGGLHHRYVTDEEGYVKQLLFDRCGEGEGVRALEGYIISKELLLDLMERCRAENLYRFHRDGILTWLREGGKMKLYVHQGYARTIRSVEDYYEANKDMLCRELRNQLFPADRPVRTRLHEGVSTYYGEDAVSVNSLVADNCIIEGSVENCIIFSGVRIGKGAKLRNCIVMRGCHVGDWSELDCVIADKACDFAPGTILTGSSKLPMVVPKRTVI